LLACLFFAHCERAGWGSQCGGSGPARLGRTFGPPDALDIRGLSLAL